VEALVRWRSAQRGMLWPLQFVPLAEETGLIVPMGRWVLEEACGAVHEWTRSNPARRPLSVSVNLSALQFAQYRLAEDVAATLKSTGLPAAQLCLEITETVLMTDTVATTATLDTLRRLGVRVAIDDFGTGYSSLSYLKRFPVDVVKLDRAFIEGLVTDPVDTEIAAAVVRLAAALGMQAIAEGVPLVPSLPHSSWTSGRRTTVTRPWPTFRCTAPSSGIGAGESRLPDPPRAHRRSARSPAICEVG
jgi:EAL domain-containing protein (putative c-di-GMP-specific phosphodiesterase class I)